MSRIPTSDLHELVRSLNVSERKKFHAFVSGHERAGGKIYVQLFNALLSQKIYDEKKIRKKFPQLTSARFANLKKYLHDLVIESLRVAHAYSGEEMRMRNILSEIEVLYEKRLMKQCLKLIRKTKRKAKELQRHVLLYELISWEERVLNETLNIPREENEVEELLEEGERVLKTVRTINRYRTLLHRIHRLFVSKGMLSKEEDIRSLEKIIEPLRKGEIAKPDAYQEYYFYHNLMGMYHMMKSDWNSTFSERRALILHIEKNPVQIALAPQLYASALANFIVTCEYTQHFRDLHSTFSKVLIMLEDERWKSNHTVQVRLLGACSSMLHYYIHSGEFAEGKKLVEQITQPFESMGEEIPASTQASYRYSFAYTYFGAGEFRRSLQWINRILNERSEARQDITGISHLLNLILHFELGTESSMEYFVRSAYRYLVKKKNISGIEMLLLRFLRKDLPGIHTENELKNALIPLRDEMLKLAESPAEKRILDYFDFTVWMQSRITGERFAEVMKKNNGNREENR
ncbi:MAG: hypothetical protein HY064_05850 [Bacteroidetes bacterium]|nr:hypothetical protein [Bacteroidota bacterium]